MGWEIRNGKNYYYTKERKGDRVVSRYLGMGQLAELADALATAQQAEREGEREKRKVEIEALRAEDQADDELFKAVELLTADFLIASGFRRHNRGEWRKTRCRRQNS